MEKAYGLLFFFYRNAVVVWIAVDPFVVGNDPSKRGPGIDHEFQGRIFGVEPALFHVQRLQVLFRAAQYSLTKHREERVYLRNRFSSVC